MYSLSSQAKRPHWEDSDEGIHPQAPVRHSSRGISGTTASNSGVAAAVASSRARESASQVAKQLDYEEVDNYLEEEEQAHFSPPMTYRNEKARFSTQGASAVGVFAVQGPGIDEENQVYDSTVDDYTNLGSEDHSMNNRNMTLNPSQDQEPIEAHRVSDDEEMHNQAKEIAEMVHKELMAKATVPVEVRSGGPPSTQDTSSLVTQEDEISVGQRNKRLILVAIGLLVTIVAVGVGVGVSFKPDDPTPLPPDHVTPRAEVFQEFLGPISGEQLNDTNSPQFQALTWLANDDTANMTIGVDSEAAIKTRYVAAVLYYAFHGDTWTTKHNFLSEEDACAWNGKNSEDVEAGLLCSPEKEVEALVLPANNLRGSIPREIGYYTNLINLTLSNNMVEGSLASLVNLTFLENVNVTLNAMTGTLPEFFFTHPSLTQIDLKHNRFFGSISNSLGKSSQLRVFWARNNSLTGTIPSAVGQSWVLGSLSLTSNQLTGKIPDFTSSSGMWDLHLGQNKLTGTIPTTIGSISSLNTLDLAGNGNDGRIGIRGSIPSELGKCQNLYYLFLDNNTLAESIPPELGSIPALQYLFVASNGLTGTIPVELGNTPLTQMDLQSNYLTGDIGPVIDSFPHSLELFFVGGNKLWGTIPTSIGSFSSLTDIDFGRNDMNGTTPSQFGELPSLEALRLGENKFVGTLPMSIASLPNLSLLHVYGNDLTGSLDEFCTVWNDPFGLKNFAANTCGESEIECPCCNQCCSVDIFECRAI